MAEDFDSSIATKEAELETLKSAMEEIRQRFLKQSADFIAKWYEDTINGRVVSDSENTKKLGKEKLAEMKAMLKDLISKADVVAKEFLSDSGTWWHLSPNDQGVFSSPYSSPYGQYDNRCSDLLDKPIRYALGKVSTILEKFGYKIESNWHRQYSYNPKEQGAYYTFALDWSKEMQLTIGNYTESYKEAYKKFVELKNLKRQKEQKEADDLWKSA